MKERLENFARYAGLATVAVEWLALIVFYLLKPEEFVGENAISSFAVMPETKAVFSICITLAAVFFWIFARHHLPKYYNTPVQIFTASMVGYGALAVVPYDPTDFLSDVVHRLLAMFFAITFTLGIFLVGKKNNDSQVKFVSQFVAALSATGLVAFVVLSFAGKNSLTFLLEVLVAVIGQAWIVWISLHSFKKVGALVK